MRIAGMLSLFAFAIAGLAIAYVVYGALAGCDECNDITDRLRERAAATRDEPATATAV